MNATFVFFYTPHPYVLHGLVGQHRTLGAMLRDMRDCTKRARVTGLTPRARECVVAIIFYEPLTEKIPGRSFLFSLFSCWLGGEVGAHVQVEDVVVVAGRFRKKYRARETHARFSEKTFLHRAYVIYIPDGMMLGSALFFYGLNMLKLYNIFYSGPSSLSGSSA